MLKKLVPTYFAKNIYDVDPDFFVEEGVKTLLIDLDNTLAGHKEKIASEETVLYIEKLLALGIRVYIISNNRFKRVSTYANSLGLEFLSGTRKPLRFKIRKFLKKRHIGLDGLMMIGDQILTDVFCANRLGVKIILTDKLINDDQWSTKINRLLEGPIRRYLVRKNKLKEWRKHG